MPARRSASALVIMCVAAAAAQGAVEAAGAPPLSQARLLAAPAGADGAFRIGVEIALAPGAVTYWRMPGEAGAPPRFDFAGSRNVAATTVAYPVPTRIREGDVEAFGYQGRVVFPVRVTPAAAGAPIRVALRLDYAACDRICLPVRADLAIDLPAATTDAQAVADAEARTPRTLDAAQAAALATVASAGPAAWRVTPAAGVEASDLFAEADGFYLETKRDGAGFLVSVAEHPAGRAAPEGILFTMAQPSGAVEFAAIPPR